MSAETMALNKNRIGDLRRSAVVSTFGPGAIIDFRAEGAPISVVAAGMEEWDRRAPPAGLLNEQTIFEPRLQRQLGVKGFRLPPVDPDADGGSTLTLIGVRFPEWLQCPSCNALKRASKWNRNPGMAARTCGSCTAQAPGQRAVNVVPVRFISACENGHLDEFPWDWWVQHKADCSGSSLRLDSEGAGLAGLFVSCTSCKARRSMDGSFSAKALQGLRCRGRRPWLAAEPQQCDLSPRVLQRGASNLYYPLTHSALDIPPWSDNIQKMLGQYWEAIRTAFPDDRAKFIEVMMPMLGPIGMTAQQIAQLVEERIAILESADVVNIRLDEYKQFVSGKKSVPQESGEFEIRPGKVPSAMQRYFDHMVRAVRLREVRAISAFTRIDPPFAGSEAGRQRLAAIQLGRLDWLPAIEVRGEGIFLALNRVKVGEWENISSVKQRAEQINQAFRADWVSRVGEDVEPDREITARFLLLHTLAHVLMRQLSLECGYSSASLRERVYAGQGAMDMCGLLIYTATSDADGTLGGLMRQGLPDRMAALCTAGIRSMEWCSSDPLCIEGMTMVSDDLNLAACHSCVLAPETSCEEYNRFLDRALLVGRPDDPSVGFFRELVVSPEVPDDRIRTE
jgi:hypothetical protein